MNDELKGKILSNTFVDNVRNQMKIDEDQYKTLCELLETLSHELNGKQVIDKELALILYSMPQMIRNIFLSFKKEDGQIADIARRLEDIWVELDALVIECLS